MCKLVIVGNGFDRAHNMKTTYWHFRSFIEDKHPEILDVLEHYSLKSKNTLWNDFENNLSKIDIDRLRDYSQIATVRGRNDDDYYSGEDDGVANFLQDELDFIYGWADLVEEWITDYVELPEDMCFKKKLFSDDNFYLSFNYTDTLEYTYGINDTQVIHIHGRAGYPIEIIMGHRDDKHLENVNESQVDYVYDPKESSLIKAVLKYLKASYKDVYSIINEWDVYLEQYKNVKEIHIIGWSLNFIDMPYFDNILRIVPQKSPIYIYYYDEEAKRKFNKILSKYKVNHKIILLDVGVLKK
jgi:hypothetical protein